MERTEQLSQRSILLFWLPLAATWLMMAVEGPFLAAVIARLAEAKFNLAAYGVAFAIAMVVESPVVMLMTASTALAEDANSFRKLRRFGYLLCAATTGGLLVLLLPAVYGPLMEGLLALPEDVAKLTYGAMWALLPWPAAIGYRRFYQGLLIRDGRTRLVAVGTALRISAMALAALVLYVALELPGAQVAAAAMSVGVCTEAVASRWMARSSIRRLLGMRSASSEPALGYRAISRFYYPLALTSLIGFAVHPMLTFFMGRAPAPVESLAVFPVVVSLAFVFRSVCLAFQEVTITLIGKGFEQLAPLRSFAIMLGCATTAGIALVGLTPFSGFWFETVSGLTADLAAYAIIPTVVLIPVPFLSAILALQRGILVTAHVTRPITLATAVEIGCIAIGFPLAVSVFGWVGVTAAAVASLVGRAASVSVLAPWVVFVVRRTSSADGRPRSSFGASRTSNGHQVTP